MSFKDGDFVKVEYSAWRTADNSLVFTTDKKKAEESGIYNKDVKYGPQLIVLGKKSVIKGLEEVLKGMSLNETKKIEIEPKDAFGERSSDLVRVIPIADFRKRDINPYPGMQLDIDGATAIVKSVTSGRVLVDLNHPLAGEKLVYEIKVDSLISDIKEKVNAIADSYSLKPDSVSVNNAVATAVFGPNTKKDADYFVNKTAFVNTVLSYLDSISKVEVKEEFEREKQKEPEVIDKEAKQAESKKD
jgi:FKBP-type peptidyl-prolyl cis-trans isomerase 2